MQDAKVVDNACLALSRIAQAFSSSPKSLEMLCEYGLITNAVQLVSFGFNSSLQMSLSAPCLNWLRNGLNCPNLDC